MILTGKVTSLVAKKDVLLATRIEEAIKKNESLESLSVDGVRRDIARTRISQQQGSNMKIFRTSSSKTSGRSTSEKSSGVPRKSSGRSTSQKSTGMLAKVAATRPSTRKSSSGKPGKPITQSKGKSGKPASQFKPTKKVVKGSKFTSSSSSKKPIKISVVGFRGRSSSPSEKN